MTLFPMIQPEIEEQRSLPLYREVAWNYRENCPIFQNGAPVIVTGQEAVLVWAWKTLQVERKRFEIYTHDYGCEILTLIGKQYSEQLKRVTAARYVKECLLVNPYITEIVDTSVDFDGDKLMISCEMVTVYGKMTLGGELNV